MDNITAPPINETETAKPKDWWRTAEWKKNVGLGRKRSAAKQRRLRKTRLAMGGGQYAC